MRRCTGTRATKWRLVYVPLTRGLRLFECWSFPHFFARFAAGLEKLLREKSGCGIRTGKEENTGSLFESPVLNSDLGCVGVYFLMTFLP